MKRYGDKKATEFSKKQVNVVYANAKNGALSVEKWVIKEMYDLADYFDYDFNNVVEKCEAEIKDIIECVFGRDFNKAQRLVDEYTEKHFNLKGKKTQEKCDRAVLA